MVNADAKPSAAFFARPTNNSSSRGRRSWNSSSDQGGGHRAAMTRSASSGPRSVGAAKNTSLRLQRLEVSQKGRQVARRQLVQQSAGHHGSVTVSALSNFLLRERRRDSENVAHVQIVSTFTGYKPFHLLAVVHPKPLRLKTLRNACRRLQDRLAQLHPAVARGNATEERTFRCLILGCGVTGHAAGLAEN